MSKWFASAVQVAGVAGVTVGAFLWSPIAGWVVGGFGTLVIGVALERDNA